LDPPSAIKHHLDGSWIKPMLLFEDPRRQLVRPIVIPYGYCILKNNRAAVELGGDQVNRDSRVFHAVLPSLVLRIHARERWKQRWVNIQNGVRESLDEDGAKPPHETREAHQLDIAVLELLDQLSIVLIARRESRLVLIVDNESFDAGLLCPLQPGGIRTIGNHHRNLGVEALLSDGINKCLEVTPAARDEKAQAP
jgi:hypothetical protein